MYISWEPFHTSFSFFHINIYFIFFWLKVQPAILALSFNRGLDFHVHVQLWIYTSWECFNISSSFPDQMLLEKNFHYFSKYFNYSGKMIKICKVYIQTNRRIDRRTDGQKDRLTDRQIEIRKVHSSFQLRWALKKTSKGLEMLPIMTNHLFFEKEMWW